jgi:hypothetical protein
VNGREKKEGREGERVEEKERVEEAGESKEERKGDAATRLVGVAKLSEVFTVPPVVCVCVCVCVCELT